MARTKLALQTLGLCNPVDADQGRVANVLEDIVQDGRLRLAMIDAEGMVNSE